LSRSYKKHPGHCDRNPFMKQKANEKVRHYDDLINGMMYKKVTCSWDIHDFKCLIWGAKDLEYAEREPFDPKTWYRKAPQKLKCFKELKKTRDYLRARMK
jgi:hypothetical protein